MYRKELGRTSIRCSRTRELDTNSVELCLFAHESSFSVRLMKKGYVACRFRRTKLQGRNIRPTYNSGYQTMNIWAGFSSHGRIPLLRIIRSFESKTYQAIIDSHILPHMCYVYDVPAESLLHEDYFGPNQDQIIAMHLSNRDQLRRRWPA